MKTTNPRNVRIGDRVKADMGRVLKAVYERQMDGSVTNLDEALAAAKELL